MNKLFITSSDLDIQNFLWCCFNQPEWALGIIEKKLACRNAKGGKPFIPDPPRATGGVTAAPSYKKKEKHERPT